MFLASEAILYREALTQRRSLTPVLTQSHPPLVLHPILHPFPIVRTLSRITLCTQLLIGTYFSLLPTPSPELLHTPAHPHSHHPSSAHDIYLQNQSAWEPSRSDSLIGSKRSYDYGVDDFFTDVKKRRVNPSYDPRELSPFFYSLCTSADILFFKFRYGRTAQ